VSDRKPAETNARKRQSILARGYEGASSPLGSALLGNPQELLRQAKIRDSLLVEMDWFSSMLEPALALEPYYCKRGIVDCVDRDR
jgi:hypothetical protein